MVSFLLKSIKEQRYGSVCLHGQLPNLLPPPSDGHCKISVTAAATVYPRNVVSVEARRAAAADPPVHRICLLR